MSRVFRSGSQGAWPFIKNAKGRVLLDDVFASKQSLCTNEIFPSAQSLKVRFGAVLLQCLES